MTDNVMTQTTLSHPPFTEAILKTKPILVTNECQTDSSWLTELLAPRHQGAPLNPEPNQPISKQVEQDEMIRQIQATPVQVRDHTHTAMSTEITSVLQTTPPSLIPSSGVIPIQTPPTLPIKHRVEQSLNEPLRDTAVQKLAQPTKSEEVKMLLFGNQQNPSDAVTMVTRVQPPMPQPPIATAAVPKSQIDTHKKTELLEKLFPGNQTGSKKDSQTNHQTAAIRQTAKPTDVKGLEKGFKRHQTQEIIESTHSEPQITPVTKATPTSTGSNELLKRLFPTPTPVAMETSSMVAKETSSTVAKETSSTSNISWPERIENMHHGLPAMASDGDRYGTRRSNGSILDEGSNHTTEQTDKRKNSGTTTEGQRDGAKYGRRAAHETKVSGKKPIFGGGGGGGESEEPRGIHIFGSNTQGDGYPWEIPIDLAPPQSDQLQQVGRLGIANSNHSALEDDIEELVI